MIKYCEEGCDISSDISDTEFTAITSGEWVSKSVKRSVKIV